ncbi:MAG: cyclic-di-AMP receptor [Anaerolineae bacterium]|nr:cyclic-di-AMP receptor [Anaerolineae bacterium]
MSTKLIIIILRGGGCDRLIHLLHDAQYAVTEFSSMGGFLRRGSTTLVLGVAPDRVEAALELIRTTCPTPPDADEHNATIFVLDAGQFVQV